MRFKIQRYNPETDPRPYLRAFELPEDERYTGMMLLEALERFRREEEGLSYRRSCTEGVCGSDGMSINGVNGLACITPLEDLKDPVVIRPLPGMPIIRDLVVDMSNFYEQYRDVEPYLIAEEPVPEVELKQSPAERAQLDGLYECILCGCCSAACPSYWWNPDRFLGPAALLQAARFIQDSRDEATERRLERLDDAYKLFRCHTIMNCAQVCPKSLNPGRAIGQIRQRMLKRAL